MGFWSGSTVVVTGAHGFTGSHLCRELLKAGAAVRALVKPVANLENLADICDDVELVHGDITDPSGLLSAFRGGDYLFSPAAIVPVGEAGASPDQAVRVNTFGAYYVAFGAMRSGIKKMLHISTCHVYGNQPDREFPISETAVPRPTEVYAMSKHAGEVLVNAVAAQGLPVVTSRAFAKYGQGQTTRFLIPNVIVQLLRGEEVRLGDPRPTRDYSYIVDIVRGYMLILEKGVPGEIYHLSSGVERSAGEIYEFLVRMCGANGRVVWNNTVREHDIMRQVGDSSKARKELGWEPQVEFEDGIRMTVEWWRERLYERSLRSKG